MTLGGDPRSPRSGIISSPLDRPSFAPRHSAPASHWAPTEKVPSTGLGVPRAPPSTLVRTRFDLERALYGLCHWHGPRTGRPPRLGTDVLLSRNAVVELRSGALESVRARWQTLFRASCLPFTPAIGVGWSESTNVSLICTNCELV